MKKTKRKLKSHDGEHLFRVLIDTMKQYPVYLTPDDDLKTTGGVLQTAIYFIDRMADDYEARIRATKRICP